MDLAYDISDFIINTSYRDLSAEAIDIAKKDILDILGVSLAGSRHEVIQKLYALISQWGGNPESTVLVHGGKFPLPNAVFVNSAMANALDYDDTHERGGVHTGCVVVPVSFALSEINGNINGQKFLTSVCIGIELACRLGMAAITRKPLLRSGWTYPTLHGYFSSAAVAGRMLGLNEQQMHNALGLAYHQASGNAQSHHDGADVKMIGPGFASRGGTTAAFMAKMGISGTRNVFDAGPLSFFNVYHAGCNREVMLQGLGKKYEMYDLGFKPYTSCRASHHYIDAVIKLVKENNILPEEVDEIIPHTCEEVYTLCTPPEVKNQPENPISAQFSLPWILACGAARKKVGMSEFTEEALKDPVLFALTAKIHPVLDPILLNKEVPATIKVRTKRGTFETRTGSPYGSLKNPMTFDDIQNKFMDCATSCARSIPDRNIKLVIEMVKNLEDVENVTEISGLLT
jgi:2-methylcitrate dehydratase PrpD